MTAIFPFRLLLSSGMMAGRRSPTHSWRFTATAVAGVCFPPNAF
jgi:hypothetical protein